MPYNLGALLLSVTVLLVIDVLPKINQKLEILHHNFFLQNIF